MIFGNDHLRRRKTKMPLLTEKKTKKQEQSEILQEVQVLTAEDSPINLRFGSSAKSFVWRKKY